jgi:hypothetical protein
LIVFIKGRAGKNFFNLMYTYITIASTTPTDLLAYASGLFTDLWLVIALAIGIPLAFYVIKKVIGLMPKR